MTNAIKQSKVRVEGWRGRSVREGVTEDNVNKDLESLSETYKDLRGECLVAGVGVGSRQERSAKG